MVRTAGRRKSIGVIVEFKFKSTSQGASLLTDTLRERLRSVTRTFDGCEHVHLYADPDDPNHLVLVQRWESREKYERYQEWAMAPAGTGELLLLLEREMTTVYLEDTGA